MINLQDNYSNQAENDCFEVAVCSVIGDRNEQQDRVGYSLKYSDGVVAVCDGMGGHSGGKKASVIALEQFLQQWKCRTPETAPRKFLIETVMMLNTLVTGLKHDDGTAMRAGTTFSAILLEQRQLHWVSVGDSRIYVYRRPELVRITQDHTYQALQDAGQLPPSLPCVETPSSVLVSFLGVGELPRIERNRGPLELRSGDTVLLFSDGLYKLVAEQEVSNILSERRPPAETVQKLIFRAQENKKANRLAADNISVAVVNIK